MPPVQEGGSRNYAQATNGDIGAGPEPPHRRDLGGGKGAKSLSLRRSGAGGPATTQPPGPHRGAEPEASGAFLSPNALYFLRQPLAASPIMSQYSPNSSLASSGSPMHSIFSSSGPTHCGAGRKIIRGVMGMRGPASTRTPLAVPRLCPHLAQVGQLLHHQLPHLVGGQVLLLPLHGVAVELVDDGLDGLLHVGELLAVLQGGGEMVRYQMDTPRMEG